MEWKLGEHWFAYFILILSFTAVGTVLLFLLDLLEIKGIPGFLVLLFSMSIIFAPITKYWHRKFINKDKKQG